MTVENFFISVVIIFASIGICYAIRTFCLVDDYLSRYGEENELLNASLHIVNMLSNDTEKGKIYFAFRDNLSSESEDNLNSLIGLLSSGQNQVTYTIKRDTLRRLRQRLLEYFDRDDELLRERQND